MKLLVAAVGQRMPACRKRAELCGSPGRATYPHALAGVIVAEQLYRAWTSTQNHPYHRG